MTLKLFFLLGALLFTSKMLKVSFQSACFGDSLLQAASKTKHVELSIRWYLFCSHRGTGLLTRMPQPTSAVVASKPGN